MVNQFTLLASRMILSYESDSTTQQLSNGSQFLKCPLLLLYQRPDSFDAELSSSRSLHLDRSRFLEIDVTSGWNDILHGELHVRAATASLRVQTSDAKVVDNKLEISKRSDAGVIKFRSLSPGSKVKILVPFTVENDLNDIALKLEFSYTTNKGTFFFANNPSISIMLPLGVNVQDMFKQKALFSKFTISSATTSPLRLLKSDLEPSDTFEACSGGGLRNPVMIFPRQPASLLYKIIRRTSKTKPISFYGPRKNKSNLSLVIHYICLEEEINHAVKSALDEALSSSYLYTYSRLIISVVLSQLHLRISSYDLERIALLGELPTSIFSDVRWRDLFLGLESIDDQQEDTAALLAQWIQAWSDQQTRIALLPVDASEETISKSRSIVIPVDIPCISVVHTADIKLLRKASVLGEIVAVTNEPIPASLQIKWTRAWDWAPPFERQLDKSQYMDFVYEVSAPTDTWLVGGKRKGHFRVSYTKVEASAQVLNFPILLIPIKEGYLAYPHLEIKSSPAENKPSLDDHGGSNGAIPSVVEAQNSGVTSETDYKNLGEAIRVISNARKTTLSLDASGPQGGAWLLESEARGDETDLFAP